MSFQAKRQGVMAGSMSQDFRKLRLDRVSRSFGAHNALREVSLEVARGEFIALLGPSGCGKSTALNCLAGLLPLTGGGIWLDDRRIDLLKPEDRGFGMVFQNYALFPHMTAEKNVGFGLRMQGKPKAEVDERVAKAMALVRLEQQKHKLPGQLSGGQQQRVAIARAIVIEPPLVLMDEPLSNLDAKLRLEMRAEIRRIHNLVGSTTIYVTHDQDEALSLADRIVVMRDGEVRQVGRPDELYGRPAHADVAEFMGYRNLLTLNITAVANGFAEAALEDAAIHGSLLDRALPGDTAIVAIRPDDLTPRHNGTLRATVVSAEYRGRDFYGIATTAGGRELFFRAEHKVAPSEVLMLGADPGRVLIYPGEQRPVQS